MEITHELMLDLQQTGVRQTIYAKRGDSMTRTAKIRLFDGGTEFAVPSGTILQIAYAKSDGKGGLYDTMPDKSSACTASGNIVTAKLHPQMFTVAGLVACELRILTGSGEQLSTFNWFIAVQSSSTDGCKSEDYYNFSTLNGIIGDIGDLGDLNTSVKNNLVAAINSVYSTVDTISKRYIVGVNGRKRDVSGNVEISAEDINALVAEINYHGDVQGALAALATMTAALPVARASSADGIAYTATGDRLPTVSVADNMSQISAVGKGRQIVFVPMEKNQSTMPTLQINGGEVIPIRMRAPRNQGYNDDTPDATQPIWIGALMRGVPYTLTFCGKYWLIDSRISQFDSYNENILNIYASALMGLYDGDTVAVPIINSMDESVDDGISTMFIRRSTAENDTPDQLGNVTVPTEKRVEELIASAIGDTATALSDMDSVIGGAGA